MSTTVSTTGYRAQWGFCDAEGRPLCPWCGTRPLTQTGPDTYQSPCDVCGAPFRSALDEITEALYGMFAPPKPEPVPDLMAAMPRTPLRRQPGPTDAHVRAGLQRMEGDGRVTRVLVAVPWRPQPHREYAHTLTVQRYRDVLPDTDIIDVDTGHDPFCLAACRNRGVGIAENSGYDVVVLADADTLPEAKPLREAIEQAAYSRFVHLPYTEYRSLRADGTEQYLAGVPLEDCNHMVVDFACSGVLVTTPATWWSCGGQDEAMRGWGMEDVAFLVAHRTLLGAEFTRHAGAVYTLHHESAMKDGPQYDANVARYRRYLDAAGDLAAMRALIAERTAHLTPLA